MKEFAIVAIGYNRPQCLKRLLESLSKAYYDRNVDMIISIDNSGSNDVVEVARSFCWDFGAKRVETYPERLGLKKHILRCGNFTSEYTNLIVFEDDLVVSRYFFSYVVSTVQKYSGDDRIAGIGLYSYDFCQNSGYVFSPAVDGTDVFFIQHACSWGQVWTQDKWKKFMEWYSQNDAPFCNIENVPENVNRWNEKSWLKYHVRYCIETDRYFVFPRESLTSNYSTVGSHSKESSNKYQVPLQNGERNYVLPDFENSRAVYDAYFESVIAKKTLEDLLHGSVCFDSYGVRKNSSRCRYWLTTQNWNYKIIKTYGLEIRPRELNIIEEIDGNIFKLYDTEIREKNEFTLNISDEEICYSARDLSIKKMLHYCLSQIWIRFKRKYKG